MVKRLVELVRQDVDNSSPVSQVAEFLVNGDVTKRLIDLILVSPESVTGVPGTLFILSADFPENLELEALKSLSTVLRGIGGYGINYPIHAVTREIRAK